MEATLAVLQNWKTLSVSLMKVVPKSRRLKFTFLFKKIKTTEISVGMELEVREGQAS